MSQNTRTSTFHYCGISANFPAPCPCSSMMFAWSRCGQFRWFSSSVKFIFTRLLWLCLAQRGTMAYGDMLEGSYGCQQLHLSSFIRDVNYSCGSCGYELNLNSSNRNTSLIDSKYGKSIKRGVISFFSVDESRFTQIQQLPWSWSWLPFFNSKRQRTKLLCRRCGNHLGYAYTLPSHSWDGISDSRIYDIKLTTLLPSFDEQPTQMSEDMGGKYESASSTLVF
ncbi:hypothetical protein VNO77_00711 [Canavalia gladiata]|uniref:Uncharacterized protein n=1 Tax=Canavalia gladiata TaxID=3824 RepID=A0AAN9R4A5_CANGL